MTSKNRNCSEFIVAAIRATRPTRSALKPGTAAGKALRMVFSLAKRASYDEQEFRESISTLLESGVVLLAAHVKEVDPTAKDRLQKIRQIPADAPLEKGYWFFSAQGKSVKAREERFVTYMRQIILYVVADGLPVTVSRAISKNEITRSEQIMASLEE